MNDSLTPQAFYDAMERLYPGRAAMAWAESLPRRTIFYRCKAPQVMPYRVDTHWFAFLDGVCVGTMEQKNDARGRMITLTVTWKA
jgi:hypothetical protein